MVLAFLSVCCLFSKTYADFLGFVRLCNERVRGIPVSEEYPHKDG